jgi:hypothetical protein
VATGNPNPRDARIAKNTRSEKSKPTRFTKEAAQGVFLSHRRDGLTVAAALERVGRTQKAYEHWRRTDPEFKRLADQASQMSSQSLGDRRGEKMDFATFRRTYLNTETFWHQHQWIDILEGREPRDVHPAQTYHKGRAGRLLINTPPFHAKSNTVTMDYVTYKLCMDPGYRVIIVSASSTFAQAFLQGIKQRLTHPDYIELQKAYAPPGGWKQSAESWTQTQIVLSAADRDAAEKDPNVQVTGIRGQIYGRRCDLVVVDDAVIGANVNEWEKQLSWIRKEVASRIEAGGKLLVIGTRMASVDLYSELMNPDHYGNGKVPWTHFSSPAILEEGSSPAEHVTLWPVADQPWQPKESGDVCDLCDGSCCEPIGETEFGAPIYPRWDGVHLESGPRAENSATDWALVYQQQAMHGNMTFPEHMVVKATNPSRIAGLLQEDVPGHPPGGMRGKYVVAGCDPSIKGFAGLIVVAFDPTDGKRYLLNAINLKSPTPQELKEEMKRVTEHYSVNEWRVEKTGLLQFFTQDEAFRLWFSARGVIFTEHLTSGQTKWDPAFGVGSLATLFGAYDRVHDAHGGEVGEWRVIAPPLIELPRQNSPGVKALIHQLITWTPDLDPKKVPQDLLMALWFVETCCRERTVRQHVNASGFGRSRFAARGNQNKRTVVNLADYRAG